MDDIQNYASPFQNPNASLCLLPWIDDDFMPMVLQCFAYLSEARYWNRLWIIQEILLARSISVMYGSKTVAWDRLESMLDDILLHLKVTQKPVDEMVYAESLRHSNLARFILERQKMMSEGVDGAARLFDWYNIIQLSRESRCTDVRDRVFGVLGLVDPTFRIPVDYSLSTEHICREVLATYARHYLDSSRASKAIAKYLDRKETLLGFAEALAIALECEELMTIESKRIIEREILRSRVALNLVPTLRRFMARSKRRDIRQPRQRHVEPEVIDRHLEVTKHQSSTSRSLSDMPREAPIRAGFDVPTITVTMH
jgi:hypothetical protein